MRAFVLLLSILLAGGASAQARVSRRLSPSDIPPQLGQPAASGLSPSGLTPCASDTGCVLDCGVGVSDGGTQWQCVNGSGADVPVTQGTGTTYEDASPTADAFRCTTSAACPKVTTPDTFRTLSASDFTSIDIYAPRAIGSSPSSHYVSNQGGLNVFTGGGAGPAGCAFCRSGSCTFVNSGMTGASNKWRVHSCRASGTSYTARANGISASSSAAALAAAPSGTAFNFGQESVSASTLDFATARSRRYSRALSDSELAFREAQWFGQLVTTPAGPAAVTTTRAASRSCSPGDGNTYSIGENAACVSTKGALLCDTTTATDVHVETTSGWPTTSGEALIRYSPAGATSAAARYLLDTRNSATGPGVYVHLNTTGATLTVGSCDGTACTEGTLGSLTTVANDYYCVRIRWGAAGHSVARATGTVNGTSVTCGAFTEGTPSAATNLPTGHKSTANIGTDRSGANSALGWVHPPCIHSRIGGCQ